MPRLFLLAASRWCEGSNRSSRTPRATPPTAWLREWGEHLGTVHNPMPSQDSREESGSLKTNNLSKRCVCTRGRGVSTDGAAVGRRTGRGRCWGRGDSSLQRRRCEQWLDILAAQAQLMAPQVVVQRLHVGEDALRVWLFAHDHHVLHLHQGYTVHQHLSR